MKGLQGQVGIIFDLDGTLVDSLGQIYRSVTATRKLMRLPVIGVEDVRTRVGLPAKELFFDCPSSRVAEAVNIFRSHLRLEIVKHNQLFPGVVDLLKFNKQLGWKIGIATSKPHPLANLVVEKSQLHGLIDWTQGVLDFAPKPDPRVIFECQNALLARRYIMVGDRVEDIQAGLRASCITIGVAQGPFSTQDLIDMGAHLAFSDMIMLQSSFDQVIRALETT